MSLPEKMKVFKFQEKGKAQVVEAPLPQLRDDYVLVKVSSVALNPTDWKHIDFMTTEEGKNCTVGCDYSGTVVAVGAKVEKQWKVGDRVAGFTHGVNQVQPEDGCFGEYAVAKGDVQAKLGDALSDEEGSTIGVGISTVGQGLYQTLELPWPNKPSENAVPVLIYGGSTATGLWAIQFAKLSGFVPIVTCSARNNDLVKSYGAAAAFDYKDQDCGRKIREYTNDDLKHAFDCISESSSAEICGEAISSKGGHYSALLPVKVSRDDVKNSYTLGYTIVGESFKFIRGKEFSARPQDFEFAKKWWAFAEQLLKDGKLKIIPMDVRTGGLNKVHEGLDDLRQNRVSGKKIVYKV